ncbi:hypothetical protein FTO74_04225 [Granulicella sp. WH15]|uniref:hypothetical protein n=1 Tax=Granulicella sp. WH15 TaxID=2602070 RepID=UPI0013668A1B|nr:hypothetical protein [Granulicella sp. WH15]QHN02663.1 hypothetical protein FTO74_04225 [Granulicella sp. WH15]
MSQRTQEIKARVTEFLSLTEEATVMVTELNCQDDDCPEVETIIAIFRASQPKIQATLHSSIDEITEAEIERFCKNAQDVLQAEATVSVSDATNQPI